MFARIFAILVAASSLAACSSGAKAPEASAGNGHEAHAEKAAAAEVGRPDAEGKVRITATADEFVPNRVEAEGGKPVKLVFVREAEKSCMTRVVFPTLGIDEALPVHTPVEIEVTPEAGGTIAFQCPMGMGKSTVVGLPKS